MKNLKANKPKTGRREFISKLSSVAAMGLLAAKSMKGASPVSQNDEVDQQEFPMPTITLGQHRISRLICGSNPMLGYSYNGNHCDRYMKEYFTTERTVEFLQKCEHAGITVHQLSSRRDYLPLLRERGSKLKLIILETQREKINETIGIAEPIAIVHHGNTTDHLFADGKSNVVHDFVKAVKDKGLLAGVSAHNPDIVKRIADEGWEVDFFMTSLYFLTRNLSKEDTTPILPVGSYNFYKDDPLVMTKVIQQVKQPCLAFKILGAGRQCSSQESVRAAFKFAFGNIKPTDGIIVGMFPWYFDEISANAQYTRDLGTVKG